MSVRSALILLALVCGTPNGVLAAEPCTAVPAGNEKLRYTDDLGREVVLPASPKRIVSLAPSLTELLFAVGAGSKVVGVTRHCDYPPGVDKLPDVGGFANVSVEAVVALEPDFVLATADTTSRKRVDSLIAAGIPVYVLLPTTLDGVESAVRCTGRITGHGEVAEPLAAQMRRRREKVRERRKGKPPRVLFLLQVDPFIAAGKGTFLDEMIDEAGGVNVTREAPVAWPRLSRESLLALDPQVILTTAPAGDVAIRRLLAGTAAARSKRVHAVDTSRFQRPGPRIVDALEEMSGYLHGPHGEAVE